MMIWFFFAVVIASALSLLSASGWLVALSTALIIIVGVFDKLMDGSFRLKT